MMAPLTTLKRAVAASAALVVVLAVLLGTWSCRGEPAPEAALTVGAPALEQNALLYVAEAEGMFARNGLKVTINDYDTGAAAVGALWQGTADISQSPEFPLIAAAFERRQFSIIAINARMQIAYLVARQDRGISSIADLKGKRIGVLRGALVYFFLGRFLDLHGLSLKDVTIVDVPPAKFVDAITTGEVDALAAWQPHVYQVQQRQGEGLVVWPVNSDQPAYAILAVRDDWVMQNAAITKRFLKSLMDAQAFIARRPDAARAIVEKRLKLDATYLATTWPRHQFSLSLDLALVLAMNAEAHWMIENNLTVEKKAPDFLNYVYADALKAVDPAAVTIVR